MITADQIVCALVGDYVLQSDWMAQRKTQSLFVALIHATVYALPFLFLTQNPAVLAFIVGTHAAIDRWRLARYVCWAKNFMAPPFSWGVAFHDGCTPGALGYYAKPGSHFEMTVDHGIEHGHPVEGYDGWYWALRAKRWWHSWDECSGTGYHKDSAPWLSVWLMIIADNVMHVVLNGLALRWWP